MLVALLLLAIAPGATAVPFGNALQLDGIDDYGIVADNTTLDLGDVDGEDFTIEASVFVPNESSDTNQIIVYKNFSYFLFINFNPGSPDAIFFRFWACPSPVCELSLFNTTNLTSGWHHIAAVFDNEWTASNDRASIFLDGNTFADTTAFEMTPGVYNSTNSLYVGANAGLSAFDGWLEEARFSDVRRYQGPYPIPSSMFSPDANTRALWHFDEATGSTSFADSSGNGNTLTGQNGAQTGVPPGAMPAMPPPADFDGDGDTDLSVFRPSNRTWYVRGQFAQPFGVSTDIPVPGDYDGDGDTDIAVWRPSTGTWYVLGQFTQAFGLAGDIPVPGDYDGDGDTDLAVFRPSNGRWYIRNQTSVGFGINGDIPVPADYNGDGTTDIAVFRPSSGRWYIRNQTSVGFGISGDVPVPGDYNADGSTDIAVFRNSNGRWYIRNQTSVGFGINGDVPLPLPWAIYSSYGPSP